ncbi:MAG: hypothetical protein N4A33_06600 [Bacteriovoracaceae bacterium]|nr:hypothetical protein [Bacteriovoracaceae bacterium]
MVRIVFLLTFIFSLNGDCARITSLYLGQKDGGLFYGTTDPLLRQIGIGNEQDYIEQYNHKHFIDQFISLPIGQLEQSITKNLRNLDYCSNETLALLNEFFRYSHRLIALSYLYESIKK